MFRRRMALSGLTVAVLAGAATPAFSADSGLYVGATAGESIFHQDRSEADAAILDAFSANGITVINASSTIDKSDVAFGGLIGYRFVPNFALEAGYIDLGKLNYKFSGRVPASTTVLANATLTAKAKGPTLAALGSLPLSTSWDVYARLGIFFSKVTLTADTSITLASTNQTVGGSDSESANSVDPLVGVGIGWHAANHLSLRAEYTRFANVGDKDKTGETNIDLFSLGVTYSFR